MAGAGRASEIPSELSSPAAWPSFWSVRRSCLCPRVRQPHVRLEIAGDLGGAWALNRASSLPPRARCVLRLVDRVLLRRGHAVLRDGAVALLVARALASALLEGPTRVTETGRACASCWLRSMCTTGSRAPAALAVGHWRRHEHALVEARVPRDGPVSAVPPSRVHCPRVGSGLFSRDADGVARGAPARAREPRTPRRWCSARAGCRGSRRARS